MISSQEEVEELTALYDSEKSQNQALEEAVAAEKENFNKVEMLREFFIPWSEWLHPNFCNTNILIVYPLTPFEFLHHL